eukprot:jgi/Bigna1/85404/estExt_fgenesh1_pg.C_40007
MALISDGMFEDLKEIAENSAFMEAVKKPQVSDEMWKRVPKFENCMDLEKFLREQKQLNFETVFNKSTGFYMLKCFLIANQAVDKAIFLRDVMKFHKLEKERKESMLDYGKMNAVGVYGPAVENARQMIMDEKFSQTMFDEVGFQTELWWLKKSGVIYCWEFFLASSVQNSIKDFYVQIALHVMIKLLVPGAKVDLKDFEVFRVLGRGGFGSVKACRKRNCGNLYAMKIINKKRVKVKKALRNVMEERHVLVKISGSPFITNLKYALQDEEDLFFIMDLMLGGDLKFHLINAHHFTEERARFYAAQVLLGLEYIHSFGVIYRDLKLENVLLDHHGNARLSDLGLAVCTDKPIAGYAGTPGYTAPEMIANRRYTTSVDIFSFGVMLYRMLCGSKPFKGSTDTELDKAVLHKRPSFPTDYFTHESAHLLQGVLQKNPENRLGCGGRACRRKIVTSKSIKQPIKDHQFFATIDWGLLEEGYVDPPFVPTIDVHAPSLRDIGQFNLARIKHYKLGPHYEKEFKKFDFVSETALEEEMTKSLEKADENVNFDKFSAQARAQARLKNEAEIQQSNAQWIYYFVITSS